MKLVVLLGSPHRHGTTAALAAAFTEGARAAGHEVETVFVPGKRIAPCLGCNGCRKDGGDGACVQKDDAAAVLETIERADGIVFVSPLYYFGLTAQLKSLIDRFYAKNAALRETRQRAWLLTAGADSEEWAFEGIVSHFEIICRYMHYENAGAVKAYGCGSPEALHKTGYEAEARALGAGIR